jgi:hypothetical protein
MSVHPEPEDSAGCRMPNYTLSGLYKCQSRRLLADASDHCRVYLAHALLQRRQMLKHVAQHYLSPLEIDSFDLLGPAVLDIYAMQVDEILRHRGFIEFGPLSTYVDDEGGCHRDGASSPIHELRSIYHELSTVKDAEMYFDLGFHDISARLDKPRRWMPPHGSWSPCISLPFANWLLDHDAPLWEWVAHCEIPSSDGLANGFVLAILGDYGEHPSEQGNREVARILEERILSDRSIDRCDCRCSLRGCTPFVERLKRILNWYRKSEVEVAAKFTTYLKKYGNALQREHWHAAIRLTTFQSLGIKHTCLTRRPRERELEAEEIAEIQDEDAELLEILESLVEEFEEHAFEAIDAATDRVDRMIAFWNGYWADRMHQVLSELSRADDESKLAAEHLGVSWTAETDEEASESSELEEWDYYFRKIEEIE